MPHGHTYEPNCPVCWYKRRECIYGSTSGCCTPCGREIELNKERRPSPNGFRFISQKLDLVLQKLFCQIGCGCWPLLSFPGSGQTCEYNLERHFIAIIVQLHCLPIVQNGKCGAALLSGYCRLFCSLLHAQVPTDLVQRQAAFLGAFLMREIGAIMDGYMDLFSRNSPNNLSDEDLSEALILCSAVERTVRIIDHLDSPPILDDYIIKHLLRERLDLSSLILTHVLGSASCAKRVSSHQWLGHIGNMHERFRSSESGIMVNPIIITASHCQHIAMLGVIPPSVGGSSTSTSQTLTSKTSSTSLLGVPSTVWGEQAQYISTSLPLPLQSNRQLDLSHIGGTFPSASYEARPDALQENDLPSQPPACSAYSVGYGTGLGEQHTHQSSPCAPAFSSTTEMGYFGTHGHMNCVYSAMSPVSSANASDYFNSKLTTSAAASPDHGPAGANSTTNGNTYNLSNSGTNTQFVFTHGQPRTMMRYEAPIKPDQADLVVEGAEASHSPANPPPPPTPYDRSATRIPSTANWDTWPGGIR